MDILFVATELAPLVKVGGLADVVAALSKALRQLGHKVTLAMPRFPPLERGGLLVARRLTPLSFSLGDTQVEVTVYDGRLGSGVELVLFDVPGLYDREGVYGEAGKDYADNARRFAVFCRAAAELARQRADAGAPFDVVHAHDWPAALVPVYLQQIEKAARVVPTPTVFTIHNLAHQGLFSAQVLPKIGLGPELFTPENLEFYGKVNFLKGGLVAAKKLTTVSATYAREIQTTERGHGLDGVLAARAADLVGITNGIDYATWNPATDGTLAARYDAEDPANKERCKTAILRELGLPLSPGGPLVLHVGRMVTQKGSDLCVSILPKLVFGGATVVLVGEGDPAINRPCGHRRCGAPRAGAVRGGRSRGYRSSALRGGRHRPRPLAFRALRIGANVRAALRGSPRRARHRGALRHRGRLRLGARNGDRVSLSRAKSK